MLVALIGHRINSFISENIISMSPFRQHAKKTRELWWQGLPPSVRGKVWKLAIGNDLHITQGWFSLLAIVNS